MTITTFKEQFFQATASCVYHLFIYLGILGMRSAQIRVRVAPSGRLDPRPFSHEEIRKL